MFQVTPPKADLTTMVVLTFLLLIQGKGYPLLSVSRRDFLMGELLGFLNPFLYYGVLFKAYDQLPAQEVQPLHYTGTPTLRLFSAYWLKQRLRVSDITASLMIRR